VLVCGGRYENVFTFVKMAGLINHFISSCVNVFPFFTEERSSYGAGRFALAHFLSCREFLVKAIPLAVLRGFAGHFSSVSSCIICLDEEMMVQ